MTRRWFALMFAGLLYAAPLEAQTSGDVPGPIGAVLRDIKAADTGMLAVSEEDGRFLRVMAVVRGATRALEIGGASGYSAIWIGLAMRETGGHLTTIEYDPTRAKELLTNISRAGLTDVVTVVAGDAFKVIPSLEGSFDFVFLDAWKPDYKRFYDLVLPRLQRGGVFLAHNTVNKRDEMQDFLEAIQSSPAVFTTLVSPSQEGMSVSVRRR
ncbi:MAG: O-methyltransferase [Vicinamibacterales bacterium]